MRSTPKPSPQGVFGAEGAKPGAKHHQVWTSRLKGARGSLVRSTRHTCAEGTGEAGAEGTCLAAKRQGSTCCRQVAKPPAPALEKRGGKPGAKHQAYRCRRHLCAFPLPKAGGKPGAKRLAYICARRAQMRLGCRSRCFHRYTSAQRAEIARRNAYVRVGRRPTSPRAGA